MDLWFCRRARARFACVLVASFAQIAGLPMAASAQQVAVAPPSLALATATQSAAIDAPHPPLRQETALAGDAARTRFIIGLERAVEFQVSSLPNPNRVIVELPEVRLQLPTFSADRPVGLVQSFRGGLSAPGRTKIVIDVTKPVIVEKASIDKGKDGHSPRLILEIVPVDAGDKSAAVRKVVANGAMLAGLGASGVQPPLPRPARRPEQRVEGIFKPIVVIDPGHGGHDSGAQKFGTVEKDVVLAFSMKLRDKLVASGRYKVLMTRDRDVFVELDERRDFADRSKAQLFIAVHADYAGARASGATVYSLRDSTMKDLQRSARSEATNLSQADLAPLAKVHGDVSLVTSWLTELAQKDIDATKGRTKFFADSVVEFMGASTTMMNNPDREANFRVLKSAKMPSVLIELAYVTNKSDADNLKSDTWREKVSSSISRAVDNYFTNQVAKLPM